MQPVFSLPGQNPARPAQTPEHEFHKVVSEQADVDDDSTEKKEAEALEFYALAKLGKYYDFYPFVLSADDKKLIEPLRAQQARVNFKDTAQHEAFDVMLDGLKTKLIPLAALARQRFRYVEGLKSIKYNFSGSLSPEEKKFVLKYTAAPELLLDPAVKKAAYAILARIEGARYPAKYILEMYGPPPQ